MTFASSQPSRTLRDAVVTLRAHHPDDVDAIVEQCRDPESLRWTTVPRGYTRADARAFVEHVGREWADPTGNRSWAIEFVDPSDRGDHRFGGTIDLRPGPSPSVASIGFGLHPAARGRGLVSRAVRLVAEHGFTDRLWGRPLTRIHWRAIAGNWGSRRVAWATGFTFHDTLPASHVDPAHRDGPALDSWNGSLGAEDTLRPRLPWFTPPPLAGRAIRLREWRDSDGDAIEDRSGDPVHWMPGTAVLRRDGFDTALLTRRLRMANGAALHWCVADAATDAALGDVVLFGRGGPLTGDTAELGYQLNPSARGRGVARDAAALAVGFARRTVDAGGLGMRRLVAQTAADNTASNRVLESLGFTVCGREHAVEPLAHGGYGDALHWELRDSPATD